MFKKIRNDIANFIAGKNSMNIGSEFLRHGNRGGSNIYPDWSNVVMSDIDHYTGYSYAAIRNRANTVARIATKFSKTESNKKDLVHPYLMMIKDSKTFSEWMFWQTISTYLDLEGVYYLMVLRNADGDRIGSPLSFKLLNPYNITRVLKQETFEVGAYRENRKGFVRDIPPEMIIEIRDLNPFDQDEPFAMTDAARESSYTLKTAGNYTRHALKGNQNAPGIVSTDQILPDKEFKNFVANMKDHPKGEPVYGNGAGAVKWESMDTDLTKAALNDVNENNRDELHAVYGVSKTIMGIEQSGTTRETANVQKDLMIENQAVPRIQLIDDALNLDYKNRYPEEYKSNNAFITIDNPIESDQDTEAKKVDIKQAKLDLYQELRDAGYKKDIASQYVEGKIDVEGLGEPTEEVKQKEQPLSIPLVPPAKKGVKKNALEAKKVSQTSIIEDQQSLLQNAIVNIDQQLVMFAINRIPKKIKNDIKSESDVILLSEKKQVQNELLAVFKSFYGIIAVYQGKDFADDRESEFGFGFSYTLDDVIKENIDKISKLVSTTHVDTVSKDLYTIARKGALAGEGQDKIIRLLKENYNQSITEVRAKSVARTETNRAFTMTQFDVDRQFIEENELQTRAFKKWETRSDNPCAYCQALEAEGEIPFDNDFRKLGQKVTVEINGKEESLKVNFLALTSGNAHPNCSCDYKLIIKEA